MGTVFFSDANELATVSNVFKVAGVATDPTAVTLTITSPTGVTTTPTPSHTGTGAYSADVACGEAGTWQYEYVGTGTASDAVAGTWEVQETQLGRLYATLEALKSRLDITNTDDDLELYGACFGASRWLEQHTERHFWRTASTEVRTFEPSDGYCLKLPEFNDLVSVTTFKTDGGDGTFPTTWAAADYQLLPLNPTAAPERKPYTRIRALARTLPIQGGIGVRADSIQITGVFGWPAVPQAVKQAAALLAAEPYTPEVAPLGVAGEGEFAIPISNQTQLAKTILVPYRRNAVYVA
jgi:hypothetical protein